MRVLTVYDDGSMLSPAIVALTNNDIIAKF